MSTTYEQTLKSTAIEISNLVSVGTEADKSLSEIVVLIGNRFETDVCSVYLLEPNRSHLVLAATVGLKQECIGRVRMKLDEGLAGLVAERLVPVAVAEAAKHPRFKYFREAGEDGYESFLGVPLFDRGVLQGVLIVQTVEPRTFSEGEIETLSSSAATLGPLVRDARNLDQFIAPSHERLWTIARNLWWSWNGDGAQLFRELDPLKWRSLDHNPIALLADMPVGELQERAGQLVLYSRINQVYHRLQEYLEKRLTWSTTNAGILKSRPVAYFSAEFGLHESLPIYSGGLGVLAGDHIKSASDLGVPLVGVGLFYTQGYFHQWLDDFNWQHEDYVDNVTAKLPLAPAIDRNGVPVVVQVDTRTGPIQVKVWRLAVGRCTLLLLDSDLPGNASEDRELTARLYYGDSRVRIRQELLLGVGGMRALEALGIDPGVLHLNEGHSAFAPLEKVRSVMASDGIDLESAMQTVAKQCVFTTHTPVPAGHDRFHPELVEEHLGPLRDALKIDLQHLLSYGRVNPGDPTEEFCMTVLALKLSSKANAVSSLHGHVSRNMWSCLWPQLSEEEVPIGHITNGVHVLSWLAPEMHQLYDRYLGVGWTLKSSNPEVWQRIFDVDDGELWEAHLALKSRLIDFARRRVAACEERGSGYAETQDSKPGNHGRYDSPAGHLKERPLLRPDALTIGFARRFATYKRANLILSDMEYLFDLVSDAQRPIQLIFAGKAHPRDEPGKKVLRQIAQLAQDADLEGKIVFVEDYDINVGRHLVQGVDVWLNNPRRPLEASGTSGQKVVLNGGLNLSILDGWWAEAFDGTNGFAIGNGRSHVSKQLQDQRDAQSMYDVLENEIVPLYYSRDRHGLPTQWIAYMKNAIASLGWRFNADRMVKDYVKHCYIPAAGGRSSQMS